MKPVTVGAVVATGRNQNVTIPYVPFEVLSEWRVNLYG